MVDVAGRSRVNRPYFFREANGDRMEIPAFGVGQGDLDGNELREFQMYVSAHQIALAQVQAAPENTVLPVISGATIVAETLSVTDGTWVGVPSPSFTYQWRADGADISGATAATYLIDAADEGAEIDCVVTATNAVGSDTATANAVGPVTAE